MHRKVFILFAWLLIFAMMTSTTALAMPELPPDAPAPAAVVRYQSIQLSRDIVRRSTSTALPAEDGFVGAQAIALGKPTAFNYEATYGETGVAYFDDADHINGVVGMLVDDDGNVYMGEEGGSRLLKFAPNKSLVWKVGIAGLRDWGVTGFSSPKDMAFGPDDVLWVVDSDIVTRVAPEDGEVLSRYPEFPWEVDGSRRFNNLTGIAFDEESHVYFADRGRNRIEVYNLNPAGEIAGYQATIGTTDEWGGDNNHFDNPSQVISDADGNLLITDLFNHRVQRCVPNEFYTEWTCSTALGVSQEAGGDDTHLAMPYGMGADPNNPGVIFITDNGNGRVKRCVDAAGTLTCTDFLIGLSWPTEVAVAPTSGVIYVSDYNDYTVKSYSPAGVLLENEFAGTVGIPYATDDEHFNTPRGVDVDAKGSIYVVEDWGHRLIKLDAAGEPLWVKGIAGVPYYPGDDPDMLQGPTAVVVDPSGKKVAVSTNGGRVRFYNTADGAYLSELTKDEDNYRFDYITGLAYDKSGNLYVADGNAQVVRIYNKLGVYVRKLGTMYETGLDSAHFNNPRGLVTDASGNLYVADQQNCRVQKFDKNGKFLMTFGTTRCGGEYDRMGGPVDVAVDSAKNVYVAEEWNARVSVYNAAGAYLGYIGGSYNDKSGGLKNAVAVTVDKKGKVYVADMFNSRVQRYKIGVPYAAKISHDNFGGRGYIQVWALGFFKGQLYAGTTQSDRGVQIWRQTKTGWESVVTDGFEDGGNYGIDSLYEYKGYLYASTFNCTNQECTTSNGGQLWRSPDGATWQPVIWDGFDNPDNAEIFRLAKLGSKLCASTWGLHNPAELWCSESGEPGTWQSAITPGFGDANNAAILAMQEFNGVFFAATANTTTGAKLYRKTPTTIWQPMTFPTGDNIGIADLTIYKGYLYAIARPMVDGPAEVWRCKTCDGNDWVQVDNGFDGAVGSMVAPSLKATKSALFAVLGNRKLGMSVWMSKDGLKWTQISTYGLGNSNNTIAYWGNGTVANSSNLFIGTYPDGGSGGAVWKVCASASCK